MSSDSQSPYIMKGKGDNRKYFIGIVILIVLMSTGGIFFLLSRNSNTTNDKETNTSVPSATNQPSQPNRTPNKNTVISSILQRYSFVATNSAATAITLTTQYKGTITELNIGKGVAKYINDFPYAAAIRIKGKGEIENQIFLSKDDISKIKVVQKTGEEELPLGFNDLRSGDSITFDMVDDKMKDARNSIIYAKITKE